MKDKITAIMERHPIFNNFLENNEALSAEIKQDDVLISIRDVDTVIERVLDKNEDFEILLEAAKEEIEKLNKQITFFKNAGINMSKANSLFQSQRERALYALKGMLNSTTKGLADLNGFGYERRKAAETISKIESENNGE